MLDTLLAIQTRLGSQLTYLAKKNATDKAIYIMTDRVIPEITDFPAIGLKDGNITYNIIGGTMAGGAEFEEILQIKVTAFVELLRQEEVITGDGHGKGILEVAGDIKAALLGYLVNTAALDPLTILSEGESQVMSSDTVMIQMKELIFTCTKQVNI